MRPPFFGLFLGLSAFCSGAGAHAIEIAGWPVPSVDVIEQFPSSVFSHPITGSMACPSAIEVQYRNENTIHSAFTKAHVSQVSGTTSWTLVPSGLSTWWDGSLVTTKELSDFLVATIKATSANWPGTNWSIPDFSVTSSQSGIVVTFSSTPEFGPYVISRQPLLKNTSQEQIGFTCTGPYRITKGKSSAELILNRRGKEGKYSELILRHAPTKTTEISFDSAHSFGGSPWVRMSDEKAKCAEPIDTPAFAIIRWNSDIYPTNNKNIRKALTMTTPRGELLRAGAGSIGSLVSAPIIRSHPGYASHIFVRPFDFDKASNSLEKEGFRRPIKTQPRTDPLGRPFTLTIAVPAKDQSYLPKVLGDAFSLVGLTVDFVTVESQKSNSAVHGWLEIIEAKMPGGDLSGALSAILSSKQTDIHDTARQYNISLSQGQPDFKLLKKLHQKLYEEEPLTVLMQHRVCLRKKGISLPRVSKSALLSRDWLSAHLM